MPSHRILRRLWPVAVICALPLFGQSNVSETRVESRRSVEAGSPPKPFESRVALAPSQRDDLGSATKLNLGAIDETLRDQPGPGRGVLRVATHRTVTQANSTGTWQPLTNGGAVWRLQINSENALGIRVHFTNFDVGAGQVWVLDADNTSKQSFGPYTGKGRHGSGDFWSETVFSNAVEIEYTPASGGSTSGQPPLNVAEILHVWQLGPFASPRTAGSARSAADLSAFQVVPTASTISPALNFSCLADATCYASNPVVSAAAPASALIIFSDYQCSATILNTPNGEPEILTAGHCVNTETDAEGTEAFFDVQTAQCNEADSNTTLTGQKLAAFPEAVGLKLLSSSNLPFLDGSVATQVQNDLDYSLIQLNNFPNRSGSLLAGYTATDSSAGANATSVSYPDGLYLKAAFGTVQNGHASNGSYFVNAYEIDQSTNGRVDSGSSGSGIFNDSGQLIGLLSTAESCRNPKPDGSCPTDFTSCQVPSPFLAWYTKFSAVYQNVSQYLNQPLSSVLPTNSSIFSATPNPVNVTDGSGLGAVTLNVNAPGLTSFQVRVGAPNGPLFLQGAVLANATTGRWVTNGMIFYLQDVTNGKSLTTANTVETVTVNFSASSFVANPSSVPAGTDSTVVLSWDTVGYSAVQIRVGSPTGPLFAYVGGNGTATTGAWAIAGMTFYLIDPATGNTISSVALGTSNGSATSFYLTPNPIDVPTGGYPIGQTTLFWTAPSGVATAEVHVGSPNGPLFTLGGSYGSAQTGDWVTNGLMFYLQNTTGGLPLTSANTLATSTAQVVQQ